MIIFIYKSHFIVLQQMYLIIKRGARRACIFAAVLMNILKNLFMFGVGLKVK